MNQTLRLGAPLVAFLACTVSARAQCTGVTTDDFEAGENIGRWSFIEGADVIETTGGNPGAWLHQPTFDTFAPILQTRGASAFVGDYRQMGVTQISLDARTDATQFGSAGFQMSLLLRDTKGTFPVDDDDYAFFVGPQVPQPGQGWVHYDFAIPSASTASVPPGWLGGWAGDPSNFRPGVDWNTVIQSVDRVEIWWLDPQLFAIFQQWNVGADNISITAAPPLASATPRNGSGINPNTLSAVTLPALGATWSTLLDCTGHAPGLAALFFSAGKASGPTIGFGQVLFEPAGALVLSMPNAGGGSQFDLLLPADPVFCGARLTLQGLCTGGPVPQLSNALDVVLGG
jgi:hypothetical protein